MSITPKIDIAKVPAQQIASYPREFASVISGREKQRIGDAAGLTQFGVNITRINAGSASAQYLIPLGIFGFALAMVRWSTDSIYPGMALHSLNNALALGVNDLKWSAIAIVGLAAAGILTIYGITIPISGGGRGAARSAGASL